MNIRSLISFTLLLLMLGLVQIFFLKNLALFGQAFGFLYVLGILVLPSSIRTVPLLIIAFFLGLTLDVFYETIGMHAAAATAIAFVRPLWLKATSLTGGYDEAETPSLPEIGIGRFISYAFPLVFLYSLVFFTADQWGTGGLVGILSKSLFSSIFTTLLVILVQLLFFKRRRGI
ncbi:rod shape-determining protein MreD [Algoriphagus aquaeductus]|uniref:Rod shape-determining protein MreD n=1 Tax=Algoriphagus aquaeductus TaxID=475299 RepID=A0A326RNI5_9BACT|nr:rod shape-determining protein MreD [Algoriphagus aquaeductus]PZV78552.1 rod shape-determining protein MreD [Algoriphagus aquaeductus]